MVGSKRWVDAHGHLADKRWQGRQAEIIAAAQALGIQFFMQGGVGPEDWLAQKELQSKFPENIGLCFGLHPYWVADHSEAECDEALDSLATLLPQALGIGETGLDFRPHIMGESRERQMTFFEQHLELSNLCAKPVVLHLVQAHEESLRILDLWGVPQAGGMVHSFNGSAAKARDFYERGLMISVGGPVCRPENQRLHQAIQALPLEFLLIESDSPDQSPPRYAGGLNPPESIWDVARTIGELKSLDPVEILDITTENFKRLFKPGAQHGNTAN